MKITLKKLLFLFIIFSITAPLLAHEFWLQPQKFIYRKGENINVRFMVGEHFEGENWTGTKSKMNKLLLCQPGKITDLTNYISAQKGDSLQFNIQDEGTAMIAYQSNNSFISLEGELFNEYLQGDGLLNALDYRKQHAEIDSIGTEFYQRNVKTLIKVGSKRNSLNFSTDMPLDFIPYGDPYHYKANDSVTFTLLFNKVPLQNHLVKVWQKAAGKTQVINLQSGSSGNIRFKINTAGMWMVSSVNMVRLLNDPKVKWQSYWASCTWGY